MEKPRQRRRQSFSQIILTQIFLCSSHAAGAARALYLRGGRHVREQHVLARVEADDDVRRRIGAQRTARRVETRRLERGGGQRGAQFEVLYVVCAEVEEGKIGREIKISGVRGGESGQRVPCKFANKRANDSAAFGHI